MNVADRFRQIREKLGLSQTAFGKEIGVSRNVIASIEIYRMPPKEIHILSVSRRFGVNRDWLEKGEGEMLSSELVESDAEDLFLEACSGKDSNKRRLLDFLSGMGKEELQALKVLIDYAEKRLPD